MDNIKISILFLIDKYKDNNPYVNKTLYIIDDTPQSNIDNNYNHLNNINLSFYKTIPCRHFLNGNCSENNLCGFIHDETDDIVNKKKDILYYVYLKRKNKLLYSKITYHGKKSLNTSKIHNFVLLDTSKINNFLNTNKILKNNNKYQNNNTNIKNNQNNNPNNNTNIKNNQNNNSTNDTNIKNYQNNNSTNDINIENNKYLNNDKPYFNKYNSLMYLNNKNKKISLHK